jgi:hypothetical protein
MPPPARDASLAASKDGIPEAADDADAAAPPEEAEE